MIGIIFGPPGSGKGTQAAKIEEEFGLKHLSTGDILRHEVASGTAVGKEAARIMAAGDLVPDELIVDIVRRRLPDAEAGAGVLLDGFPRTLAQAQALDRMLADEGHRHVTSGDRADLLEQFLHRLGAADHGKGGQSPFLGGR